MNVFKWPWKRITTTPERRYRRILLHPDVLSGLFGEGTQRTEALEKVPDLRVLYIRWDDQLGMAELLCESATFDPVPIMQDIPLWRPEHRLVTA